MTSNENAFENINGALSEIEDEKVRETLKLLARSAQSALEDEDPQGKAMAAMGLNALVNVTVVLPDDVVSDAVTGIIIVEADELFEANALKTFEWQGLRRHSCSPNCNCDPHDDTVCYRNFNVVPPVCVNGRMGQPFEEPD